MLVFSRRDLLCSASLVNSAIKCDGRTKHLSVEECADIICKETPQELRQAVKETQRVLFRGEGVEIASILWLTPDLLNEGTYDDPGALAYFSCMEAFLNDKHIFAKPSTGHIATSSIDDAIPWGNPVSIWPLDHHWSYVWAEDRKLLYPGTCANDQENFLVLNERISVALQEGKEVLFSTVDSASPKTRVLAAPSGLTVNLMSLLSKKQYGL